MHALSLVLPRCSTPIVGDGLRLLNRQGQRPWIGRGHVPPPESISCSGGGVHYHFYVIVLTIMNVLFALQEARAVPTRRPPRLTPQQALTKNRRHAHMDKLDKDGYFSEEMMRQRCSSSLIFLWMVAKRISRQIEIASCVLHLIQLWLSERRYSLVISPSWTPFLD